MIVRDDKSGASWIARIPSPVMMPRAHGAGCDPGRWGVLHETTRAPETWFGRDRRLLVFRRGVLARASLDTCTVLPPEEPTLAGTVIAQYQYRRPLLVPPVMPKAEQAPRRLRPIRLLRDRRPAVRATGPAA